MNVLLGLKCSNEHITVGIKSENFKYVGSSLINQNPMNEEIRFRLITRHSCYCPIKTLLSS